FRWLPSLPAAARPLRTEHLPRGTFGNPDRVPDRPPTGGLRAPPGHPRYSWTVPVPAQLGRRARHADKRGPTRNGLPRISETIRRLSGTSQLPQGAAGGRHGRAQVRSTPRRFQDVLGGLPRRVSALLPTPQRPAGTPPS